MFQNASPPVVEPAITYAALVGKVIERYRSAARITQADVAQALGITQPAYSRLEQGETAMSLAQLRVVAARLGRSPSDLLAQADQLSRQLQAQGVEVKDEKGISGAAILVALGILAALFAAMK